MKRVSSLFLLFVLFAASAFAQSTFDFDTMLNLKRVGDPQLSPDGKTVLYTVGVVDKKENRTLTHIFSVNIDGSGQKQLTTGTQSHGSPRWSPDGKLVAYSRGGQIWTMAPDGTGSKQITNIATGAGGTVWSPDGRSIAFLSEVFPECATDECNKAEDEKIAASKVKAKVATRLLFKHWDEWRDRKRTHVFIVPSSGGTARDLTPGDFDSPPYSAASGMDIAFSPDSSEVAIIKNLDKIEAASTNSDIFVMPVTGGNAKNITVNNKGYDASPFYTTDGKYILFRSQERAGFEADRWRIMRYDRKSGETVELSGGFDLQANNFVVGKDNKQIFFTAGSRGRSKVFTVPVEPDFRLRIATHVRELAGSFAPFSYISNLNISPDGAKAVFLTSSMASPAEVFAADINRVSMTALSRIRPNLNVATPEELEWKGANDTPVHGFLLKPANFDEKKKYPLIVLIHGGPQGAWNDNWGYRWNPQIFANAGYVVFMPNPRGSTGYGQKFVDEISGDWGGKVFDDLKNGVAAVINKPYIDKDRIGGAGASYGGYMVDWILGHNDDPRFKFKALVSHAGVYNLSSMAATTEELFFVKWEFNGMPWENSENYEKWSPDKFVKKFSTPTLVTAGEQDFRVPVDQSLQLFTALQLQGVDSKLVIFPDEGHWILKPQNSEFWHSNVLGWFEKHLK